MQEIQEKGQMRVKIQTAEVDREVSNECVHVRIQYTLHCMC